MRFWICRHENKLFLHEQVDLQTRSVLRRVHDRDVHKPRCYMGDQVLRDVDVNAKCYVGVCAPHRSDPLEQERLPKADFASHGQYGAMTLGYRHLLPRALPQLYERRGEPKELFPGGCEGRASFIPNEKRSPKLLLKQAHPRADCRLSDIQAIGGFYKASG